MPTGAVDPRAPVPSPTTVLATERKVAPSADARPTAFVGVDPINSDSGHRDGKHWGTVTACRPAPAITRPTASNLHTNAAPSESTTSDGSDALVYKGLTPVARSGPAQRPVLPIPDLRHPRAQID